MYPYEAWAEANLDIRERRGPEFKVPCPNPLHDDEHPSCDFNVEKGVFHCFSCGYGKSIGDDLELFGIELKTATIRSRLNKIKNPEDTVSTFVPESMLNRYMVQTDYWISRGLNEETQDLFHLGYDAIANAATIPVRDFAGRLLGVTRRFLAPDHVGPRYKYPKGFKASQNLFASWLYDEYDIRTISIHEGAIDAMRLWQVGIPATALYGSNLSSEHVHMLLQMGVKKVVYFGDADGPGQRAKQRAKGFWQRPDNSYQYRKDTDLSKNFIMYHVTDYCGKKDAGEMTDREIIMAWNSAEPYQFSASTRKYTVPVPLRTRIKNYGKM